MRTSVIIPLFLLPLLIIPQLASADEYEDVVYLKNGSIIHGIIIEQVPDVSLKIETEGGNVLVFSMDEIEKITKEKIGGAIEGPVITTMEISKEKPKGLRTGFTGFSGGGLSLFFYNGTHAYANIGSVFGGGVGSGRLFLGAGVDYLIPDILNVYFQPRIFFMPQSKFSPYMYLIGGAAFAFVSDEGETYTGQGILFGGGAGIDFRSSSGVGFFVGGGYSPILAIGDGATYISGIEIKGGVSY